MYKNIFKKVLVVAFFVLNINVVFAEADTVPPVITIKGESSISITKGDVYTDAGANAADDIDGDITDNLNIVNPVDSSVPNIYTVTYNVSDSSGNAATEVKRIVTVVDVPVTPPTHLSIDTTVDVPATCEVLDTDNVSHTYTSTSSDSYIGICALKAALDSTTLLNVKFSNKYPSMGLFVTAFNNTEANSDSQYWALYQNSGYTDFGISTLPIKSGDVISFKLSDFAGVETGDSVIIRVGSLIVPPVTPPTHLSIDTTVDVPATCEVLDTDNVSHTYTSTSSDSYIGICALKAALDSTTLLNVKFSNKYPSMGLFVTAFNNTEANSDSQYWALYQNSGYTDFGISTLPIKSGDVISFKLSDFAGVETGDSVIIRVGSLIVSSTNSNQSSGSGGGSSSEIKKEFSLDRAFEFLNKNIGSDGSYGNSMYTDWAAVAIGAGNNADLKSKLINYLKSDSVDSSILTDYERRAMALMSLNINPYNGTDTNYIEKIIESFDGNQFGDISLVNDDIFALIVLKNAGYTSSDDMIKKDVDYIISQQKNGSWGSVDMTAAGISALDGLEDIDGVSNAVSDAKNYISSNNSLLGFGNPFSASWVIQSGIGDSETSDYLVSLQEEDGGIKVSGDDLNSRIWATSYAIPAVLGKNWNQILKNFGKIIVESKVETKNEVDIVSTPLSLDLPVDKTEDFILSTEKPIERPIVKNEKIKSNITKDSISVEDISDNSIKQIPKEDVLKDTNSMPTSGFLEYFNGLWSLFKSSLSWLFAKLSF